MSRDGHGLDTHHGHTVSASLCGMCINLLLEKREREADVVLGSILTHAHPHK